MSEGHHRGLDDSFPHCGLSPVVALSIHRMNDRISASVMFCSLISSKPWQIVASTHPPLKTHKMTDKPMLSHIFLDYG